MPQMLVGTRRALLKSRPAVDLASLIANTVAHYNLDEASGNALDSVGSETLTDNNTVTSGVGLQGTARQFTAASGEYLSHTDDAIVSPGTGSLGLHCHVNFDTLANMGIAGQFGPAGSYSYLLYLDHGASPVDRLHFYVSADGTALVEVPASSFGAVTTGVWYDVNVWFDLTSGTINIQVNNGVIDSVAFTGPIFDGTAPFYIGRWSTGEYMNGRVDQLSLLKSASGPPSTAAQRTWLYNGGAGRPWPWVP